VELAGAKEDMTRLHYYVKDFKTRLRAKKTRIKS